jgi:hypothetical protein
MSRAWQCAAPLLAASLISCAGSPSARISERRLDGPRPAQAILRCEAEGLAPPVKIAWTLPPDVRQVGWGVPSNDEVALLVQLPDKGGSAQCTATGRDGATVKAERSLDVLSISNASVKIRPSDPADMITLRGSGFGQTRGPDDAVYLVPPWGEALPLDHGCKGASWSESLIVACQPRSVRWPSPPLLLRVQAGGELAQAPSPVAVVR